MSPLHLQLVVNTGLEVVQYNHLRVRREAVLFLDAHSDQCLDGCAASNASNARSARYLIIFWKINSILI